MKTTISITVGIFIACLILLVVWRVHHQNDLPLIKDADQLRKDCVRLCAQFPLLALNTNQMLFKELNNTNLSESFRRGLRQNHFREIPCESWPDSIQKLHPFHVIRDEYAVAIWLIKNTGQGSKGNWVAEGYYVHTNSSNAPPRSATHGFARYYLHETQYEGIDKCVLPGAVL